MRRFLVLHSQIKTEQDIPINAPTNLLRELCTIKPSL